MSSQSHVLSDSILNLTPRYLDAKVDFTVQGISGQATVHYIAAGAPSLPTILLLHGFPSSSHQYRDLIPLLSDLYHVIAPDLPGFGLTQVPDNFIYSFESLTVVIEAWIKKLGLKDMIMYLFDYGAPVGFHVAKNNPSNIKGIITQNGNAYDEGFGKTFWAPIFKLWETNSQDIRNLIREKVLTLEGIKPQYINGVPEEDLSLVDPTTWQLDYYQNIAGPTNVSKQLDLFYDYRNNVKNYPAFHKYFRDSKVPILAVWGKNDISFIPPGAEAFKRDSPDAKVYFVDSGHFALENKRWEIVRIVKKWLLTVEF